MLKQKPRDKTAMPATFQSGGFRVRFILFSYQRKLGSNKIVCRDLCESQKGRQGCFSAGAGLLEAGDLFWSSSNVLCGSQSATKPSVKVTDLGLTLIVLELRLRQGLLSVTERQVGAELGFLGLRSFSHEPPPSLQAATASPSSQGPRSSLASHRVLQLHCPCVGA